MFFRRQSHVGSQWVGLIHEGAVVHAAKVSHSADARPCVHWVWQADAPTLESGLRALRSTQRLRGASLVGVLDRSRYRMQAADAPDIPREDWRDAMRWQLKEQLDFPIEDAVLDVLDVPTSTQLRQNNAVMAFVVPREHYAGVELAADDVGLHWDALDVPETALRNICALGEEPDKAHALMVFGQAYGLLVITFKGALLMARHIEVAADALTGSEDVRGAALSRAALEMLRTVDTFERMHSQASLSGMTVALPPGCGQEVVDMLADLIYVPIAPLQLKLWFDMDGLGDQGERLNINPTFNELCAIGTTLRVPLAVSADADETPPPPAQQLQLLDATSVLGQSPSWGALLGLRLMAGLAAVGAVVVLGLSAATKAYTLSADGVETEINTLRLAAAANPPSPVVKELDALRQKEAQQRQMQDALQGSMAWASQGYSDYLMALGRQAVPQVWITSLTVRGDGRDLVLVGRTTDATSLPAYLHKLSQEEHFRGRRFAQFEIAHPTSDAVADSVVEFTLRGTAPAEWHRDGSKSK
jgi:MSHA biogenesis protein MshI